MPINDGTFTFGIRIICYDASWQSAFGGNRYKTGHGSHGDVYKRQDLDQPLEGKDVLIVEDIIDSGRTLSYLIEILKQRNPNSIRLCTLLDKMCIRDRHRSCAG